jgi:hypothetical protein
MLYIDYSKSTTMNQVGFSFIAVGSVSANSNEEANFTEFNPKKS